MRGQLGDHSMTIEAIASLTFDNTNVEELHWALELWRDYGTQIVASAQIGYGIIEVGGGIFVAAGS